MADSSLYPIPPGFRLKGEISTDFEHWGKYTTTYSSNGYTGHSQGWNNDKVMKLNMIAAG